MPNNYTIPNQPIIEEDEIDLRELFGTIWRYKWSIMITTILITIATAIVTYKMPKYYKTTTIVEVKPKDDDKARLSLGSAGALLGLTGSGSASSINKDAALMGMYSTSRKVLDKVNLTTQFYKYKNFRYTELPENNSSISISNLHISDFKKYGMEVIFEPISDTKFSLFAPSFFFNKQLGEFSYGVPIKTENFHMTIHKNTKGIVPDKVKLNANKRHIFNTIISKNLSSTVDKDNPLLTISYFDTIPQRAEAYVSKLISNYINISIGFDIEDAQITIDSLNNQIKEFEEKVESASKHMEEFKSDNKILEPRAQAQALIRGKEKTAEQIIQFNYQLDLLNQLVKHTEKNKNIDAIAPVLVELQDQPTLALVTKLQELELEIASLSQKFKPAYPKLKSIQNQIRAIKSKIRSNLKNLKKTMKARERSLKKRQKEYASKLQVAPTAEKELREILRKFTLNEKLYTYLLQQRASTELKKAEAISRFRIIEPIYTNPAPAKPKKSLIVIVGFTTALILSIFLAFFREFLKGSRER